jgi:phosphoribosylamine---glycine ligase
VWVRARVRGKESETLKVLVIGGGGREHALAWKLFRSNAVQAVYATPGNPGIAQIGACVPCDPDPACYVRLARELEVELTVVGPEAPLVAGTVDAFRAEGLAIVGPTAAAAQLEGSKRFAKDFMQRHAIPTARYGTASSMEQVEQELAGCSYPVVLKADGLAAGKGVVIVRDEAEARQVAKDMLEGKLVGDAGRQLVVEEFLEGREVSFICLTDGHTIVPLQPTEDHKAIYDGDQGPNTGGMGAYCDSRIVPEEEAGALVDRCIAPVVEGMRQEGMPFTGFLYAGLMMTVAGPKVLEYNVRMGDPETQPLMHRLESDWAEVLLACARGDLAGAGKPSWRTDPSVCVVMASEGYPGAYPKGRKIHGIPAAEAAGAMVFHAGTRVKDGTVVTDGGRVLGVTASGATLSEAIQSVYRAVDQIFFEGMQYRRDIAKKGLIRWGV